MRGCEGCVRDKWEIGGAEHERYRFCARFISQKVYYCSKACQKGTYFSLHLISLITHWTGSGESQAPAHKIVCGKEEQIVRALTQEVRGKSFNLLGWAHPAAEVVQNWRS